MRSDEGLDKSVVDDEAWDEDPVTGRENALLNRYRLPRATKGRMSLSGHERNRLFLNEGGKSFVDVSGVSGVDLPQDSRSIAVWDFDRDGAQDLAVIGVNAPLLHLFRNGFGSRAGGMVAVRLVGGNRSARVGNNWSNRDGIGARVAVEAGGRTRHVESRCGEGLAAQNTGALLVGIGHAAQADSIVVRWPSGRVQRVGAVAAGDQVTLFENASDSPDGSGVTRTRHVVEGRPTPTRPVAERLGMFALSAETGLRQPLRMYTSVASWCSACREHVPELAHLRSRYGDNQLAMVAVPTDPSDPREKVEAFMRELKPAYRLSNATAAEREAFDALVEKRLGLVKLPATVVTDAEGSVLAVYGGVPTVSDIAALASLNRRPPKPVAAQTHLGP